MKTVFAICVLLALCAGVQAAGDPGPMQPISRFDQAQLELRYSIAFSEDNTPITDDNMSTDMVEGEEPVKRKSAFKAFILSLAVPGLGQWYYGNRWKPFAFLGAEAVGWYLHTHYNSKGDDMTADFEAYNDQYWSETRYSDALEYTYGWRDDDSSNTDPDCNCPEISHHLPDTKTQQYYEMTGKYDQFAWGWEDAELPDGRTLDSFDVNSPPPRIYPSQEATVPLSPMRDLYNQMRGDADVQYDHATKAVYLIIANHLVAAFEAYLTTNSINSELDKDPSEFSRIKITPELKSIYSWKDTPMVRFTYKF